MDVQPETVEPYPRKGAMRWSKVNEMNGAFLKLFFVDFEHMITTETHLGDFSQ